MNLANDCVVALARAASVAALGVLIAVLLRPFLASEGGRAGRIGWALLLAPYLTPMVLVGYGYKAFALSLIHHPMGSELIYDLLLWFRLTPLAALILYFAPSTISAEALHCYRLIGRPRWFVWFSGSARMAAVAFAIVFLFVFSEFELASLLGVKSWTVTLFDAHAGGLPLKNSLRLALLPLICEAVVLLAAMALLFGNSGARRGSLTQRRGTRWLAWAFAGVASLLVAFVPLALVLHGAFEGFSVVTQNFVLGKDLMASGCFALAASVCAFAAAGFAQRRATAILLSVVGLLGALLVSLLVLAVFQTPPLRALYDTPLPLLIALGLLLLPFAVLVRALLRMESPQEAVHLARLAGARRVVWQMTTRPQFWTVFLLFCWAYFELTASSLLAPSGMTPVLVRLYNMMHYGQIAGLSAMLLVAFAVPPALLLAARAGMELFLRRKAHG